MSRISHGPEATGQPAAPAALHAAARWNALGLRFKAAQRYHAARRCYKRAVGLLLASRPLDREGVATLFHNLGGIAYALGEFTEGETFARAGIRVRLAGLADAALVAKDLIALAALVDGQRRFDEAEQLYLSGLAILRAMPEHDTFEIAVALGGLGCQYAERGHHAAAVRLLERSAALKRCCRNADDSSRRLTQHNLVIARASLHGH